MGSVVSLSPKRGHLRGLLLWCFPEFLYKHPLEVDVAGLRALHFVRCRVKGRERRTPSMERQNVACIEVLLVNFRAQDV